MKFGVDIHASLGMSCNQFSDLLTFNKVPPSGQICNKTLICITVILVFDKDCLEAV